MGAAPLRRRAAARKSAAAPLRVLVVDDSSLMRRVITDLVKQAGDLDLVGEAVDGLEALDRAQALQPDVILLDIEMPRMDGLGFLRAARLRIPARVIVVSSLARLGNPASREALALGASDIIPKPSGVLSLDLAAARGAALLAAIRGCRPLTGASRERA